MNCTDALIFSSTPERRDAEVEKDHDDNGGREECAVVGAVLPACSGAPEDRSEGEDGQEEEGADYFEPELSGDVAEGLEESGDAATHVAGSLSCGATSSGDICGRIRLLLGRCRRRIAAHGLTGHAPSYAYSNPKYPADGLRSHFFRLQRRPAICKGPG
jgi:hypothetical protein